MDGIAIVVLGVLLAAAVALLAVALTQGPAGSAALRGPHRIADVSDRGGSLRETLDAVCEIIVPELADFCMIDLIAADGVERVAVRVGPGGGEKAVQRPRRAPALAAGADGGRRRRAPRSSPASSSGCPRPTCASSPTTSEDLEFLRGLGVRSAITVALRARGRLTGALTLGVAWSGRRYRRDHADFAARPLGPGRADARQRRPLLRPRARRSRRGRRSPRPCSTACCRRRCRTSPAGRWRRSYRPAGAENEVGGDFYDAFPAAGGWMLVIGDVTGRGARAASVTAQARYTLRTAAALTGDPLVALATLNRALLARGDSALCSVAALAISEDPLQPVRLAVAGHPPPLLVDGDAVAEVAGAGPGARRLRRRRLGARPRRGRAGPAAGRRHRRDRRGLRAGGPLRRGAAAGRARRRHQPGAGRAAPGRRRCSPSPRAASTTTSRSSP